VSPAHSPDMASTAAGPLIFLMAGEPSGDALGARLMAALRRETNGSVRFAGIGGERMIEAGLASLFPMEELSVMGLAEVLPRALGILRRIRQTAAEVLALKPAAVVSIDATGFCFRVEKRLKGAGIPLIHYVAPMVWAWRPWQARALAKFLDHLMALLPFEAPYFERYGVATTFVGHSVIEEPIAMADGPGFRARHGIPREAPLLAVLPGSRGAEAKRLLPVFGATLALLKDRVAGLHVVVPTVAGVAAEVERAAAAWPVPVFVVRGAAETFAAFAAADAALAASGTVSLELALARCPMVIAYKASPLTAWMVRHFMIKVRYVTVVNLLLDRAVIPELLQENCRPERLADAVAALLSDPAAGRAQIAAALGAIGQLGTGDVPPSRRAARTILGVIAEKTKAGRMA
jgi:lipid-A-disaccharide synthase